MIQANTLNKQQKEKEARKNITFSKIYNFVEKKILLASTANHYSVWYQIPVFVVGLPTYSLAYCREYIQDNLKKNGFKTTFYSPNLLEITWGDN